MYRFFLFLTILFLAGSIVTKVAKGTTKSFTQPLCFIENKEKGKSFANNIGRNFDYYTPIQHNVSMFINTHGISYLFYSKNETQSSRKSDLNENRDYNDSASMRVYRLDMHFVGSNPETIAEVGINAELRTNYISILTGLPSCGESFKNIIYRNIYPGIDWNLYVTNDQIEYDFTVHSGADLGRIKIAFEGATGIEVTDNGYSVCTPAGSVCENNHNCFESETGKRVDVKYTIKNGMLGFASDSYEGSLVIDPILSWSTYYGGQNAHVTDMTYSHSSGLLLTGHTTSPNMIATTGAFQTIYGGNNDAFIAKFDTGGILQWATYFGGGAVEQSFGLSLDTSGNIYITGITTGTTGIATPGSFQSVSGGGFSDAFLSKFSPSGALIWSTYFGGSGDEMATAVSTDMQNNVFITGYTTSTDSIATTGAYKTYISGDNAQTFIAKFSPTGSLTWATYYGGNDDTKAVGIGNDASGNVYIAGTTGATDSIVTTGAYQSSFTSSDDVGFIAKFSATGNFLWGTYYGTNGSNELETLTTDTSGNVYVAGSTSCTDSIATPGTFQSSLIGPANAFAAKFNTLGILQWGSYFGKGAEGADGIFTDASRHVWITGSTASDTGLATAGAYQPRLAGDLDAFVAEFSDSGTLKQSTYFGGPNFDDGYALTTDENGRIYIAGVTQSATGIASPGAWDTTFNATEPNDNIFLAKFSSLHSTEKTSIINAQPIKILLYPNPANTFVWIETSGCTRGTISINDLHGIHITEIRLDGTQDQQLINLDSLKQGSYLVTVTYDSKVLHQLLTVIH